MAMVTEELLLVTTALLEFSIDTVNEGISPPAVAEPGCLLNTSLVAVLDETAKLLDTA